MGLYAEPSGVKLDWCKQHGVKTNAVGKELPPDKLLVAFMDNRAFQAIAVAFSKEETSRLWNGRPDAVWYIVDKAELRKVVAGGDRLKELK